MGSYVLTRDLSARTRKWHLTRTDAAAHTLVRTNVCRLITRRSQVQILTPPPTKHLFRRGPAPSTPDLPFPGSHRKLTRRSRSWGCEPWKRAMEEQPWKNGKVKDEPERPRLIGGGGLRAPRAFLQERSHRWGPLAASRSQRPCEATDHSVRRWPEARSNAELCDRRASSPAGISRRGARARSDAAR